MAKRGRPAKVQTSEATKETGKSVEVGNNGYGDTGVMAPSDDMSFDGSDRLAAYDKHAGQSTELEDTTILDVPTIEESDASAVKEDTVTEVTEQETEKPTESEVTDKEPKVDKIEEKTEETTVPYGALKEEREKRKELQKKVDAFEGSGQDDQIQQLIEDNRKLMEKISDGNVDDDFVDPQLKTVQNENTELRQRLEALEKESQVSKEDKQTNALNKAIDDTDAKLAKEGYKGFKDFGQSVVERRILDMLASDPVLGKAHQNPEGWMKIYKQEYARIGQFFQQKTEDDNIDAKTKLKEEANLAKSRTVQESDSKEKKPWTYQDYAKLRTESGLFG